MGGDGPSLAIARHVLATTYDDLPAAAVDAAKRSLLDAVGVTLAASTLGEASAPFAEIARESESDRGGTVIGFGFRAAPGLAAFANGAMAHALDYEDTFDPALVHPNAAVVPAALAVAEAAGGVSGRELIAAVAVGADLTCRIGLTIGGHDDADFSPRFMCGAFGAAAAAGKLLGLDEDALVHAFALSTFQVSFPAEAMAYAASHMRGVRDAYGAQAGVVAAQLAQRGVKAFDQPFEGRHGWFAAYTGDAANVERVLDGLGRDFMGAEVSFKPWPSCRGTHAYIEAALDLIEAHGIDADGIDGARTVVSPFFANLCEPAARRQRPSTAIDAKFSIPFTVATALRHRGVGLDAFSPEALADQDVLALAARIDHAVEPSWTTEEATRGVLELRTRDGREFTRAIDAPLGHPDNPMSLEAIRRKFADCACYARTPVAPEQAARIAAAIEALENVNDVATLLA